MNPGDAERQPGFSYLWCPFCTHDAIVRSDGRPWFCLVCCQGGGRHVGMMERAARVSDAVEGRDDRRAGP